MAKMSLEEGAIAVEMIAAGSSARQMCQLSMDRSANVNHYHL